MDAIDLQLRQTLRRIERETRCLPLPRHPQPGSEGQATAFLGLIHTVHSQLRYCFRCIELRSPLVWDQAQIVPISPELLWLLSKLAEALMTPTHQSSVELLRISPLDDEDMIMTVLHAVYNSFPKRPPGYVPTHSGQTSKAAEEAVLGYSNFTRSSLPLAETVMLLQKRVGEYLAAGRAVFWQSRVLNALMVSPGQGQLEWLAVVTDALNSGDHSRHSLAWHALVTSSSNKSDQLSGSHSRVVDEIIMTESTIERPNELFNLLTAGFQLGKSSELNYHARRLLAMQRLQPETPRSHQPAVAARAMIRHIRSAMSRTEASERKSRYERWIRNEWDAPSIMFDLTEIRKIVKHLDEGAMVDLVSDQIAQLFVLHHRGLKAVCAKLRALARSPAVDINLSILESKRASEFKDDIEDIVNAIHRIHEFRLSAAQISLDEPAVGQVFEGNRMIGTDADQLQRPRRLWDLLFNTTIESVYTSLPWVAISHSWAQADGDCFCFINERANVVPWATRADINYVREAMLQTGLTLGWMDKICLRQRGVDGLDSAIRRLEWVSDIPFIDVAYRKASKILVYLEGAGRPILYRTTFRARSSWLERKWTAQETPRGVPLVLASEGSCVEGDFFDLCEEVVKRWHAEKHTNSSTETDNCPKCCETRKSLFAVQSLRNLAEDAPNSTKIIHIWNVVQGRSAGCDADHVFSLLSLLGVTKRPLYDPRYNTEQAASLLVERLAPEMLEVLMSAEQKACFDGLFSTPPAPTLGRAHTQLAVFRAQRITADTDSDSTAAARYQLKGIFSQRQTVYQVSDGEVSKLVDATNSTPCACQRANKPLDIDNRVIHRDFMIWHGIEACCAVLVGGTSNLSMSQEDQRAFRNASHIILSDNHLACVLFSLMEESVRQRNVYRILRSGDTVAFTITPQWTITAKSEQSRNIVVEL